MSERRRRDAGPPGDSERREGDRRRQEEEVFSKLHADFQHVSEERDLYRDLAYRDPLTGVENRRAFDEKLAVLIDIHQAHSEPLAIILIDLDNFHEINETFGHQGGDDVLKRTASTLRSTARDTDTVTRTGGDE